MRVSIVATALHGSETKPYLNLVNSNSNNGGSPIRNNGYSEGLFYQNKDIESNTFNSIEGATALKLDESLRLMNRNKIL